MQKEEKAQKNDNMRTNLITFNDTLLFWHYRSKSLEKGVMEPRNIGKNILLLFTSEREREREFTSIQ